ncbi:MAG: TIGR04552 family protein [Myxococcota bacterium]|nr:TIGR04552 family protein [Myxococcota bacterium]
MARPRRIRFEPFKPLHKFSLFDLEMVRLVLRGGSVLDWHKLNLRVPEAKAFCRANGLDLDNPEHVALVARIRDESVLYLREVLSFPVPRPVRSASLPDLMKMASDMSNRHRQLCACTLLKTMQIINHFDASEACQALVMTDRELFQAAERRIYRAISHMMADRLPIVEFMGGRKQRTSMLTKLLSKNTPLSTQLFDKMRFRVIAATLDDIFPIINYLARNLFPFNYVLAGESYNTLLPFVSYCSKHPHLNRLVAKLQMDAEVENQLQPLTNYHSSPEYKVVHWVADMPLPIPDHLHAFRTDGVNPIPRPVVYVRTELQIMDRKSNRQNERGHASHTRYKERQLKSVAARLKVGLRRV